MHKINEVEFTIITKIEKQVDRAAEFIYYNVNANTNTKEEIMMKKEPSNINQVAKKAGVSSMTVSRVINNPDKVSKETREKVLKAIDECHYYPNSFARGLASNKKYIIGIVIYDSYRTRHNMFYEMINGIERIASKFQYNIMLFSYVEGEDYANRIVESGMVDGVIFMGVTMNYNDIKYLDKIGFPYVVIGKRNIEDIEPYTLVLDYREAFQRATQYLIDSGYKEIGFVGVARDFEPDLDKLLGYQSAFYENGLLCNPENIVYFDGLHKNGLEAIEKLYDRGIHVMILTDGRRVQEVLDFACERNLTIPADLILCIFDNEKMDVNSTLRFSALIDKEIQYSVPQIEPNNFNAGQEAAKFLFSLIKGENCGSKKVNVALDFIL